MALLDIDEFATVNDLFGEKIGDTILYELSIRLKNHFKENDFLIYRTGADKFAIIAKKCDIDLDEFYNICKTFVDKIEKESIVIDEDEIDINITIGIAQGSGEIAFKYSQRVIKYARKRLQKIMIYTDEFKLQQSFENNIKWIKQLKIGFRENLFQAYFQPIVNTKTKEIYKYEALIRYVTKDGVEIAPYHFINIAKKTKFYPNIIKIVIQDAFKLIREKNKRVSINISYDDIANEETTTFIYDLLEQNRNLTQFLEFEILESEEISDFSEVSKFISGIRKFDCIVGVDDFGAGYSNFNLLTLLDIDFVKIDGSLIEKINSSKDLEIIVNTIANFSKEFKVKTVAEYVSNEEIYNKIKELNIDYCQGYYFDKPLNYNAIK